MSSSNRPGMAKNEEVVEQQARENEAIAERVHYTHRLVGMHECAPAPATASAPVAPPAAEAPAPPAPAAQEADEPASPDAQALAADESLRCPNCGAANPAAMNRSDGRQCYRCDRCAHQWGTPHEDSAEDDLPPVPSIDAPGG